jgi:glycosyltransferase involved in cell wall biosynthesis
MTTVISVIIPAYNEEHNISRALNSLIAQTLDKSFFEVIVVDDNSTDKTVEIVEKSLKKSNINHKLLKNEDRRGLSYSRNAGLKGARGKYILFLDGDDFISEYYLERMLKEMNSKNVDLVSCKIIVTDDEGKPLCRLNPKIKRKEMYSPWEFIKAYEKENLFYQIGCFLFSSEIIKSGNLKFNEQFSIFSSICEDEDFVFRYLTLCNKVGFIDEFMLFYTKHENSLTKIFDDTRLEAISLLETMASEINDDKINDFILECGIPRHLRYLAAGSIYKNKDCILLQKILHVKRYRRYLNNLKVYSRKDLLRKIDILIMLNFPKMYCKIHRIVPKFFPKYVKLLV